MVRLSGGYGGGGGGGVRRSWEVVVGDNNRHNYFMRRRNVGCLKTSTGTAVNTFRYHHNSKYYFETANHYHKKNDVKIKKMSQKRISSYYDYYDKRCFSSSSNDQQKSERVSLHQTSRAKAVALMRFSNSHIKNKSSFENRRISSSTATNDNNKEVIQASNQGLTKFAELQQQQQQQREEEQKHDRTHYIKGGTPCDPAQPPFKLSSYGPDSLYTLVLLRHGESEWNSQNRYTGWCDVNLTERGVEEAKNAGRLLHRNGVQLDHAFTSVLKRACHTANWALECAQQHWVPLTKSWRLNERHYGALQGYGKDTAYQDLKLDQELVMEMRRSYLTRPPIMQDDHPYWHGHDRRYQHLSKQLLDNTRAESLHDAAQRVLPFYRTQVVPSLRAGNKCLIVSHANTLRSLIKHIDGISDQDIKSMSIPTGIPMLYRLDRNMKPVDPHMDMEFRYMVEPKGYTWATAKDLGFHGVYLGDLERLQDIQLKRDSTNRDWQRIILRNVASQLNNSTNNSNNHKQKKNNNKNKDESMNYPNRGVIETRQLWWRLHTKITNQPEYQNMLLLQLIKDKLESIMIQKHRRFITMSYFDTLLNQTHTDATGKVVQPFVSMTDEQDRQRRAKEWEEMMALDAEDLSEECLIK